ncbi:probable E3 ubiquitin-protein ligase RHB1A isoform X2 [Phalaenopsis equestris]|uniref:probable E3 ubiquitin-protein ligase RHB1A isoform X2 n=1 Tax=Phalaenopsis equestris TaxID=78828 RepID=UPI0009E60CD9|nr:probable E3 ubiquitin-protein ligase RHB1A isoform X2 [Phalaenopsis equestris]
MGGCCCSSRTASGGISVYYQYPQDFEDNEPLPSTHDAQINAGSTENYASKNEQRQSADSLSMRDKTLDWCDDLIDPKNKEEFSHIHSPTSFSTDDDDVCPICLEEYDDENPRIFTKCKHHFHLSCILEWFERSNKCAVCDQLMEVADMDLFDRTMQFVG